MGPIVWNVSLQIATAVSSLPARLPAYVQEREFGPEAAQRAAFARILLCGFDDALEVGAARIYRESRQAGFSPAESAFAVGLMAELRRPYE